MVLTPELRWGFPEAGKPGTRELPRRPVGTVGMMPTEGTEIGP
jgi:hypothetical protein